MTYDQFWQTIAASRGVVDRNRRDGNMDRQAERLEELLSVMSVDDVQAFDRIFTQFYFDAYTYDLWAAAYIIEGGCSDDGFMDFRYWLISMGRAIYEAAMADAESLADVAGGPGIEVCAFEEFGRIARRVLEQKNVPEPAEPSGASHPREPVGEWWEDDNLPERFPKLWSRFGEADA
ncbi:DUF4240 domain-containing protein [Planctomycetales bacterium ZRK34]|nr:DUF4240 domain-containing protein [Planctomycetales bacterium ZRK34]